MRLIYSVATYLIAPLIPVYLRKRGRKNPDYLENWHERFAWKLNNLSTKPIIWLHSVSVGETRAMQKLVELLSTTYPEHQILITTMTPTGRKTAQELYPTAIIHYIPYDLSIAVKQFYSCFKPQIGIIFETEIWPNLLHYAKFFNIPLFLVNARLSEKSFRGYLRFKWILMSGLNCFTAILCQDKNTSENFQNLGYNGKLMVTGNTKFDLVTTSQIVEQCRQFQQIFKHRKVITFASTREGEEELIFQEIRFNPEIVYLIIPRHPERFSLVEKILHERQIKYQKRSELTTLQPQTQVVIGDSMGEMLAYYSISYFSVIGGSFKDYGGQNPLESLYMGTPVLFGPSMFNFAEIAKNSLNTACARQFNNLSELNDFLANTNLSEIHQAMQQRCSRFMLKYQGASQLIIDNIKLK